EAVDLLARLGPDGKVLAGGQSLIPLLNMRLTAPAHLVDINRITELNTITAEPGGVRNGTLAPHRAGEGSPEARAAQPLLAQPLQRVLRRVIGNRGTVGGRSANADPSAALPAVLALLGGSVRLASSRGERDVPAAAFFVGDLETALQPGALAVSAFFTAL